MSPILSPDNTSQLPQTLLAQALASAANAIFITDRAGRIVWVNDAFTRLSGYSAAEAIGRTPALVQSGRQTESFYSRLWQTILAGEVWQGEIIDKRKDGSFFLVDEVITPLFDAQGAITHFIAIQHDITEREHRSEQDRHLAYHDVLTELPNRALFLGILQNAVVQASRSRQMLAVLFLDLDRFKPVNDTLGHAIGDHLLVAVADRLRGGVRQSDTVARFGGDEFTVLVTDLPDREVATALAAKLLEALSRPFVLRGQRIMIGASIGIAIYPCDGEDPETLLNHADQAMYWAKSHGGSSFDFYRPRSCEV